jgi:hypothetical protein
MNLLKRLDALMELWRTLIPHIAPPVQADASRWLNYSDEAVEQAILRTSKKFAASKIAADFDPSDAYRYATGTARILSGNGVIGGAQ